MTVRQGILCIQYNPKLRSRVATRLRSIQGTLFSFVTGNYYQHVLQYLGDGKVIHTRGGKCDIDDVSDFAPFFFESCAIVEPNVEAIITDLIANNKVQDKKELNEVWNEFWNMQLKPCLLRARGCSTDVIGICLVPLNRKSKNDDISYEPEKGQSFTCTGFIVSAWKESGIELFKQFSSKGVYPSDFLNCKYFTVKYIPK
jgi:hypothetical protein